MSANQGEVSVIAKYEGITTTVKLLSEQSHIEDMFPILKGSGLTAFNCVYQLQGSEKSLDFTVEIGSHREISFFDRGMKRTLSDSAEESKSQRPKIEAQLMSDDLKENPFGEKKVDMTIDGVLKFLRSLQATEDKLKLPGYIHSLEQRELQLTGRKDTVERVVDAFEMRHKAFTSVSPVSDRAQYPVVVFSGMSGLGKTRMLEEWSMLFDKADIPQPRMGVLVSYGNGHGPRKHEETMPIEPAFCWRMLLQVFAEDNMKASQLGLSSPRILPSNANDLTLPLTMEILGHVSGAKQGQTLSLFIGVDEYQKIPNGPDYHPDDENEKAEREKTNLWKLMNLFLDHRITDNVHLYPAFAGTKWGPLNIGNSSTVDTRRVPLYLLDPQMMEEVVRTSAYHHKLGSTQFRRELFFLGGLPRPSVEYMMTYSLEKNEKAFGDVWCHRVEDGIGNVLSLNELLRLIARAVSGIPFSSVTLKEQSGINDYTWNRLIDEGVCMLHRGATETGGQLDIPYCLFRLAAEAATAVDSAAASCLVQNLAYLRDHLDNVLYDIAAWKAWEVFGACLFAMRVNSFLLLGYETIKFHELFPGAVVNGCGQSVKLAPMRVYKSHESLSLNMSDNVHDHDTNQSINWVHGNDGIRPCVINGDGGQGVDFFAAMELVDGNGLLHYNDQRKVVARALGCKAATDLLKQAACVVPKCLPEGSVTVCGLFSSLASFTGNAQDLPSNSCVVSHAQHRQFHGTLSLHPACKTLIDVNKDNVSTVRLLTSVFGIAEKIVDQGGFKSVDELEKFCKDQRYEISNEDKERVIADM